MTAITGAILAGGRSRRMGGAHKAFQPLAGRPLLSHVIDRLKPQCQTVLLSVEKIDDCWNAFGLQQVADPQPGSRGPLGGVLAALETASRPASAWLLLVPCDAPFLPVDLAERLAAAALEARVEAAVASYRQHWQPTFSLWHSSLLPDLRAVVQQGRSGLKEYLESRRVATLEWPEAEPEPFFNINDAADLAAAKALLDPGGVPIS